MACGFWTKMGMSCFFGRREPTLPRSPKGEKRREKKWLFELPSSASELRCELSPATSVRGLFFALLVQLRMYIPLTYHHVMSTNAEHIGL
jgi:hypothetical protein